MPKDKNEDPKTTDPKMTIILERAENGYMVHKEMKGSGIAARACFDTLAKVVDDFFEDEVGQLALGLMMVEEDDGVEDMITVALKRTVEHLKEQKKTTRKVEV